MRWHLPALLTILLAGCTGSLSNGAGGKLTWTPPAGPGIVVYWPCLVDIPGGGGAAVHIDGKKVGDVGLCQVKHFPTTPGKHYVRFVENFALDFSGAFGLSGPSYEVPRDRPLFIRLFRMQYLEPTVVPDDVGRSDVAGMEAPRG